MNRQEHNQQVSDTILELRVISDSFRSCHCNSSIVVIHQNFVHSCLSGNIDFGPMMSPQDLNHIVADARRHAPQIGRICASPPSSVVMCSPLFLPTAFDRGLQVIHVFRHPGAHTLRLHTQHPSSSSSAVRGINPVSSLNSFQTRHASDDRRGF